MLFRKAEKPKRHTWKNTVFFHVCFNLISPISCWHVSHLSSLHCFEHALRGSSPRERLLVHLFLCAALRHMCRSLYFARNYALIFSRRHYLFREKTFWAVFTIQYIYYAVRGTKCLRSAKRLLCGMFRIIQCSLVRLYRQRNISALLQTLC